MSIQIYDIGFDRAIFLRVWPKVRTQDTNRNKPKIMGAKNLIRKGLAVDDPRQSVISEAWGDLSCP